MIDIKETQGPRVRMPGMVPTTLLLPERLHETMKAVRHARHRLEGSHVTLSRIYMEAVELYLSARAQQKLLEKYGREYAEETEASA